MEPWQSRLGSSTAPFPPLLCLGSLCLMLSWDGHTQTHQCFYSCTHRERFDLAPIAGFQCDLLGAAEGDSLEEMLASFVPALI